MRTLLVIDGNNLAHKCRHVFSLTHPINGQDVSVHFGFLSVLKGYMNLYNPTSVAVCWDAGKSKHRLEIFPEYKAHRVVERTQEEEDSYKDFLEQISKVKNVLHLLGVSSVEFPGIEADDLIYQTVATYYNKFHKTVVISTDKDLWQVLGIHASVVIYNPPNDEYTKTYIEGTLGLEMSDYVLWRALQGDSSDGIPGITGIGPATASKIIKEHKTSGEIYKSAEEAKFTNAINAKLLAYSQEYVERNVQLMDLSQFPDAGKVKHSLEMQYNSWEEFNLTATKRHLMKYGFASLLVPEFYAPFYKLQGVSSD